MSNTCACGEKATKYAVWVPEMAYCQYCKRCMEERLSCTGEGYEIVKISKKTYQLEMLKRSI